MVRVFIKGGVWKNSEDEILKAAVMKYGKQQWARVASLLNRKSAKQCKARWNEWLDPSVKKIDWSREEDEKLLHLAKLLPAQWRTIAPLVGRTATQCQERYETLLDEAATASSGADGGGVGEASAAAGTTGGFRVGDIDTHPESKPARPDPIDMDEDEIEMLQEARARLANTQGKKAKRKQREKMLNEAKRLADLQKRRELKQAGLLSSRMRTRVRRSKKGRREIDLGVEIPFHKPAPAGFHDTSSEREETERKRRERLGDVNAKRVNEQQYRTRDREVALAKKREEARLRALEKANAALAVAVVSQKNDPLAERKRGVLVMPEPVVGEGELEEVVKLGRVMREDSEGGGGGGGATEALLGDYSDRPLPTPMRTPKRPNTGGLSGREMVMREASNLRMMERGETPLLGGVNPELHDINTANTNDTPMIGKAVSDTPLQRKTVNQTPVRDYLQLNPGQHQHHDDASTVASASVFTATSSRDIKRMAREERRAAKRARMELEQALKALPAPQFEYELAIPENVPDEDEQEETREKEREKDQADLEKEELMRLREEAKRAYEKRSTVVKREELPRPKGDLNISCNDDANPMNLDKYERLIFDEMMTLINYDAKAHPIIDSDNNTGKKNKRKAKKRKKANESRETNDDTHLDYLPEDQLDQAKTALQTEYEQLLEEQIQKQRHLTPTLSDSDIHDTLMANNIQSSSSSISPPTTKQERVSALKLEYQSLTTAILALKKKNDKLESKLLIKNGGYAKRATSTLTDIGTKCDERNHSHIEEEVYSVLKTMEERAIPNRVERLEEEVRRLEEVEAKGQKRYGDLLHDKMRLGVLVKKRRMMEVV